MESYPTYGPVDPAIARAGLAKTEVDPTDVVRRALAKSPETDPHGIDQHAPGAKLDAGKQLTGVLLDFSRALDKVAHIGTYGANKYSRGGWQSVPDGEARYLDAMMRHLLKFGRGEEYDPEHGAEHMAAVIWNACAYLELKLRSEEAGL